jgi:Tfp pilus assembly protein FimT
MSNTVRLVLALAITGALAALATPELSGHMPVGSTTILATALAAVLHKMNAEAPKPEHKHCDEDCK